MDLTKCMKDELLPLAAELRLEVNGKMRKPEIRRAIQRWISRNDITDVWAKICQVKRKRKRSERGGMANGRSRTKKMQEMPRLSLRK